MRQFSQEFHPYNLPIFASSVAMSVGRTGRTRTTGVERPLGTLPAPGSVSSDGRLPRGFVFREGRWAAPALLSAGPASLTLSLARASGEETRCWQPSAAPGS
jgi:hypothetical protein